MSRFMRSQLSDGVLLVQTDDRLAFDCSNTAELLADLGEIDARRLYAAEGYSCMRTWCIESRRMSVDVASKRIHAARAARDFPVIFEMVADGRLHLAAVVLLAPHLTPGNAATLLQAASGRTKWDIESMLAARYPRSESLPLATGVPGQPSGMIAAGTALVDGPPTAKSVSHAPGHIAQGCSGTKPVAAERFEIRLTVGRSAHEKLRQVQALLSHAVPDGDLAEVLERVLDLAIGRLEQRKFGAAERPRRPGRPSRNARHIPAAVRHAVGERDGWRCTFVGTGGHRCGERHLLEFDHVVPVARGGQATLANLRLRCRAHNRLEAERTFGAAFIDGRGGSARVPAREKPRPESDPAQHAAAGAAQRERTLDVISALRNLGFPAERARGAAESACGPGVTVEQQVRAALKALHPKAPVAAT